MSKTVLVWKKPMWLLPTWGDVYVDYQCTHGNWSARCIHRMSVDLIRYRQAKRDGTVTFYGWSHSIREVEE